MKIKINPTVSFECYMTLTETEARALDALSGYGEEEFIKHFYKHLGKAYMEKYEVGLRSFLFSIRHTLSPQLHQINEARKVINLGIIT